MLNNSLQKIYSSDIAPNPTMNVLWMDLSENVYGARIKYFNGNSGRWEPWLLTSGADSEAADPRIQQHLIDSLVHVTQEDKDLWDSKQDSIGYTPENTSNKVIDFNHPDDETYPSSKLVYDTINNVPTDRWTDSGLTQIEPRNGKRIDVSIIDNLPEETAATIIAKIGTDSKIDSIYLPSYVDDVVETESWASLQLITGETGKIYVTLNDDIDNVHKANASYRWSGSTWISLANPLSFANQSEAEAGTENTKIMTSLRVAQSYDSRAILKVDKVTGKGLSTNDYTNIDKAKVDSLNKVVTPLEMNTWMDIGIFQVYYHSLIPTDFTALFGYEQEEGIEMYYIVDKTFESIKNKSNTVIQRMLATNGVEYKREIIEGFAQPWEVCLDISGKVDKDGVKVLSTNDYTDAAELEVAKVADRFYKQITLVQLDTNLLSGVYSLNGVVNSPTTLSDFIGVEQFGGSWTIDAIVTYSKVSPISAKQTIELSNGNRISRLVGDLGVQSDWALDVPDVSALIGQNIEIGLNADTVKIGQGATGVVEVGEEAAEVGIGAGSQLVIIAETVGGYTYIGQDNEQLNLGDGASNVYLGANAVAVKIGSSTTPIELSGNVGIGRAPHSVWKTVIGNATTDEASLYVGKTDIVDNATAKDYMAVFRMTPNNDSTGILLSRDVYGGISIGTGVSAGFGIATTNQYGGDAVDMIEFGTAGATATGRWLMLGTGAVYSLDANKIVGSNADTVIQNNALNPTRVVARVAGTATQTGDLFDVGTLANSTTFNKKFRIDVNGNTIQNNIINRRETQVTSGTTTTLTLVNARTQEFTGTLNQTLVLPVVSTLTINTVYEIVNLSSGIITINSSGGNTIKTLAAGYTIEIKCIAITGTTETSWRYGIRNNGGGKSLVSQLESEIPTGTAPLIVASTTKVTNLNADLLDDLDSSAFAKVGTGNTFTGNQVINGTTGDTVTINNTGTGNCLVVEGTSEFKNNVTFTGNGTYWEDLNMNPTNLTGGGTKPSRILFNGTTIGVAAFSASSIDEVEESIELPHKWKLGSPISFHLHQYPTSTNTGVCRYGLEYFFTEEGVAVTTSTTVYLEVAQIGTAWVKKSSSFADITPPSALGTQFHFRFWRDAPHVNDTYTGAIAISTIGVHYEADSLGSNTILTK